MHRSEFLKIRKSILVTNINWVTQICPPIEFCYFMRLFLRYDPPNMALQNAQLKGFLPSCTWAVWTNMWSFWVSKMNNCSVPSFHELLSSLGQKMCSFNHNLGSKVPNKHSKYIISSLKTLYFRIYVEFHSMFFGK